MIVRDLFPAKTCSGRILALYLCTE